MCLRIFIAPAAKYCMARIGKSAKTNCSGAVLANANERLFSISHMMLSVLAKAKNLITSFREAKAGTTD